MFLKQINYFFFFLSSSLFQLCSIHVKTLVVCPLNYGKFLNLFWYLNSAAFIVGQSSQRYFCAVTVGEDAVISAFRLVW